MLFFSRDPGAIDCWHLSLGSHAVPPKVLASFLCPVYSFDSYGLFCHKRPIQYCWGVYTCVAELLKNSFWFLRRLFAHITITFLHIFSSESEIFRWTCVRCLHFFRPRDKTPDVWDQLEVKISPRCLRSTSRICLCLVKFAIFWIFAARKDRSWLRRNLNHRNRIIYKNTLFIIYTWLYMYDCSLLFLNLSITHGVFGRYIFCGQCVSCSIHIVPIGFPWRYREKDGWAFPQQCAEILTLPSRLT